MKNNSMIKIGGSLIVIALLGKIIGFVKQLITAWIYGANQITDIYFVADSAVSMISVVTAGAISISFLSYYSKNRITNKREHKIVVSNILTWSLILAIALFIIIELFAPIVAKVLAPLYSKEKLEILEKYIHVLGISVCFIILSGTGSAALEGENIFWPAKTQNIFLGILSVFFMLVFSNKLGIYAIIIGYILGFFFHTLIVFMILWKKKLIVYIRPKWNIDVSSVMRLVPPIIVGNAVIEINHIIDKMIASGLKEGSISSLYYGQIISTDIISAILVNSLAAIFLSRFSMDVAANNFDGIKSKIKLYNNLYLLLLVPLTWIYILHTDVIVSTIFNHGSFSTSAIENTSIIIFGYALGFVFIPLRDLLMRCHYAFSDSKGPMINCIKESIVNLIVSMVGVHYFGVLGIALGTTIALFVSVLLFKKSVKKYIPCEHLLDWKEIFKIVLASFTFLLTYVIGKGLILVTSTVSTILIVVAGCISYILVLYVLHSTTLYKIYERLYSH
ncbi:polysaccharide biosynthesis C-terminal domain-containing protein [Blautia schinkii]|nr:polysaccharide biosynthesis C-terminal domain-containing protein [Blautia schinkii]